MINSRLVLIASLFSCIGNAIDLWNIIEYPVKINRNFHKNVKKLLFYSIKCEFPTNNYYLCSNYTL